MAWARDDAAYVAERMLAELWQRRHGPDARYPGTVRICPRCASTMHGRSRWDLWISSGEVRIAIDGQERATTPRVSMLDEPA